MDPDMIPTCTQIGMPQAIPAASTAWCWDPPENHTDLQEPPQCIAYHGKSTAATRTITDHAALHHPQLNARQTIAAHKHLGDTKEAPQIEEVKGFPPTQPNVYSDGSLKHPKVAQWSLGGFGVWWPKRAAERPVTQQEQSLASHRRDEAGTRLWGAATGQRSSSTRTELAAGVVSLLSGEPVHQGTDSMAFKTVADLILDDAPQRRRKPWSLRKDGDLWQIWEDLARTRGFHSILISWVKGHATDRDVKLGKATEITKVGNHIADRLAENGVEQGHHLGILRLATYYADKQQRLIQIMKKIHRVILNVLKAEHDERLLRQKAEERKAAVDFGPNHKHIVIPTIHSSPKLQEGRSLELAPPCTEGLDEEERTLLWDVWTFLNTTRWVHSEGKINGTSWIELLAHFQGSGGRLTRDELNTDSLSAGLSFKQSLEVFKKTVQRCIAMYSPEHSKDLFRPARAADPRLKSYGCPTHVPCIVGLMCIEGHGNQRLRDALATITAGHLKMQKAKTNNVDLKVLPRKISYRGPPPWRQIEPAQWIPGMSRRWIQRSRDDGESAVEGSSQKEKPTTSLKLRCQQCASLKVHNRTLIVKGKWASVWCPGCKHASTAQKWQCECRVAWHKCSEHALPGLKLKSPLREALRPKLKRRSALEPLGFRPRLAGPLRRPSAPPAAFWPEAGGPEIPLYGEFPTKADHLELLQVRTLPTLAPKVAKTGDVRGRFAFGNVGASSARCSTSGSTKKARFPGSESPVEGQRPPQRFKLSQNQPEISTEEKPQSSHFCSAARDPFLQDVNGDTQRKVDRIRFLAEMDNEPQGRRKAARTKPASLKRANDLQDQAERCMQYMRAKLPRLAHRLSKRNDEHNG